MSADELILSLPPEPEVGTVVEFGDSLARRFTRTSDDRRGWHETSSPAGHLVSWTWVWYAATEEGHTQVRIVPPDPNPLPWSTVHDLDDGSVHILDANNVQLISYKADDDRLAARIMRAVNEAGEQR